MYKTVFINFSSPETTDLVSEVSAHIADKHNAHLIGTYISPSLNIYGGVPSNILATYNDDQRKIAEAIKGEFTRVASRRNLSFEWSHGAVPMNQAVSHLVTEARTAAGSRSDRR
jgi:hypothetical protein